ncbi:MAG: XkdF-like putative serine protease domain-containing protein [Tannerellaceae bacterium]|nr:XkdF-like putative serine protease domain-containing protein [Tannerellaceae bacterium]
MEQLLIYNITITEDEDGIEKISFVESPAVERNFISFSRKSRPVRFNIESEEKRIVTGLILLADTPIYRRDARFGEHYTVFSGEVITRLIQKYFRENRTSSVNINHTTDAEGVFMFESYIKDTARGISPKEFEDVPDGSWFGSFKVENDALWNEIKKGTFKGFSIEGYLSYEEPEINTVEQLIEYLQ